MNVKVVKGPLFENRKIEVYQMLNKIISLSATEQNQDVNTKGAEKSGATEKAGMG